MKLQIGQVWVDNDKRFLGRLLEIIKIFETHALCKNLQSGRLTEIKLNRFKPNSTGYRLHKVKK